MNSYLSSDPKDDPTVLIQLAELHDGAEPSSNSVALGNLYRLRNIVDTEAGQKYTDMAKWEWYTDAGRMLICCVSGS